MKTWFVILGIFFISKNVSGQENQNKQVEKLRIELNKQMISDSKERKALDEKNIAGTPYLDKHFQKSYILKTNGSELKDIQLRYNIYSDNMEFINDGQILAVAFPSEIHRIKLGNKTFIYKQYQTGNKIQHSYFEVIHEGYFQLLKKYITTLKTPETFATADSARFIQQPPIYFLRRDQGNIYPVTSQKKLVKILQPVHQPAIDFVKTNKINGKDETKLIRLMEFLEENEN